MSGGCYVIQPCNTIMYKGGSIIVENSVRYLVVQGPSYFVTENGKFRHGDDKKMHDFVMISSRFLVISPRFRNNFSNFGKKNWLNFGKNLAIRFWQNFWQTFLAKFRQISSNFENFVKFRQMFKISQNFVFLDRFRQMTKWRNRKVPACGLCIKNRSLWHCNTTVYEGLS